MSPSKEPVTPLREGNSHAVVRGRDISRKTALIGLAFVLVVALALRLYGVSWDAGYSWTPHPDERAILSKVSELSPPPLSDISVLFDSEASPWNPRWFAYGSFPLYMLKGVELLSALVPGLDVQDMRLPARVLSALADVGTIVFVYLLGTSIWSRRSGLMAAALVALAVLHIQLSHFFAVDTFLALFSTATVFFLVRVASRGRTMDSALAGLFLGLALATKISVAPMLAAYFVAHFMYALGLAPSDDDRPAMLVDRILDAVKGAAFGGLAAIAVFLVTQPYAILDWTRFYADVVEQSEMVRRIRDYPYTRQYVDTTPVHLPASPDAHVGIWLARWHRGVRRDNLRRRSRPQVSVGRDIPRSWFRLSDGRAADDNQHHGNFGRVIHRGCRNTRQHTDA